MGILSYRRNSYNQTYTQPYAGLLFSAVILYILSILFPLVSYLIPQTEVWGYKAMVGIFMNWFEIIGYLGSVLIAASLMMQNIRKLRLLNMSGAILFAGYGLIIHAYPVLLLNTFNACVNIFFLMQIKKSKDYFTLLALPEVKTTYLEKFLTFYQQDIAKLFPGFNWDTLHQPLGFFVLRNLVPVGLFVYEPKTDGVINIKLDYVTPDYRDFKNASFTYSEQKILLKEKGFRTFITHSTVPIHQQYLRRIGFRVDSSDATLFRKEI